MSAGFASRHTCVCAGANHQTIKAHAAPFFPRPPWAISDPFDKGMGTSNGSYGSALYGKTGMHETEASHDFISPIKAAAQKQRAGRGAAACLAW